MTKEELPRARDLPLKLITDAVNNHTQSLLNKLIAETQAVDNERGEVEGRLRALENEEFRPSIKPTKQNPDVIARAGPLNVNPMDAMRRAEMDAQHKFSAEVYELREKNGKLEHKGEDLAALASVVRGALNSLRIVNPGDLASTGVSPGGVGTVTSICGLASTHGSAAILDVFLKDAAFVIDGHEDLGASRDPRLAVTLSMSKIPFSLVE
jgi:hypothetical protein